MAEYVCGECGERNEPGTEFLRVLPRLPGLGRRGRRRPAGRRLPVWTGGTRAADPAPPTGRTEPEGEEQVQTILVPRGEPPQDRPVGGGHAIPEPTEDADPTLGRFRISTPVAEATVAATGVPTTVCCR